MAQSLPHFHDPHDSCINLILPILEHSLCGASLLLHLEGEKKIDLDALQTGEEITAKMNHILFLSSGSGLFLS